MQLRCKLAEMVTSFLVQIKIRISHHFSIIFPSFFHHFSIICSRPKKSQLQWIVPGVGPGAAIAITGDATPDEVAAGVAAEAAEAAGAPLELLPPAVEEIHRSSLEKGQVHQVAEIVKLLHGSLIQWMFMGWILMDIRHDVGVLWVLAAASPGCSVSFRYSDLGPPKLMDPISNWDFKRVCLIWRGGITGYELFTLLGVHNQECEEYCLMIWCYNRAKSKLEY